MSSWLCVHHGSSARAAGGGAARAAAGEHIQKHGAGGVPGGLGGGRPADGQGPLGVLGHVAEGPVGCGEGSGDAHVFKFKLKAKTVSGEAVDFDIHMNICLDNFYY